jgi:hypothetical protein
MNTDLKPFLELIGILLIVAFHPAGIAVLVVFSGLGVWNWIVIALSISPYVIVYVVIKKKQEILYLNALMAPPREWNVDKALVAFLSVCNKKDEPDQCEQKEWQN